MDGRGASSTSVPACMPAEHLATGNRAEANRGGFPEHGEELTRMEGVEAVTTEALPAVTTEALPAASTADGASEVTAVGDGVPAKDGQGGDVRNAPACVTSRGDREWRRERP